MVVSFVNIGQKCNIRMKVSTHYKIMGSTSINPMQFVRHSQESYTKEKQDAVTLFHN